MDRRAVQAAVGFIALVIGASMLLACDDSGNAVKENVAPRDSGVGTEVDSGRPTDGGPVSDGAPTDCFANPRTHFEIINACTDAVRIVKTPALPLLSPDGGLPPLP